MEAFFYGSIAVCALLLVFRAIIFVVRVHLMRHRERVPEPAHGFAATAGAETASEATPTRPFIEAGQEVKGAGFRARSEHPTKARLSFWSVPGSYRRSLTAKMTIVFTAIIALFGLLTTATVYLALAPSLRSRIIERASISAFAISQRVPAVTSKKNIAGLGSYLRNYVAESGIAYVVVENRTGVILAHSFAVLPDEFQRSPALTQEPGPRLLELGQRAVHEVRVPAQDGKVGAVRLGIWSDHLDAEVLQTFMPLARWILLVVGLSILAAMGLAWKLNRPIVRLVEAAKSICAGVFDSPALDVDDPTEFGALSRALERLRSSIHAAMNRLTSEH